MVTKSFQYPQRLYSKTIQEAIQLPNGSWQPETEVWELVASCREETNGKGTMINTADGRALAFTSLIQLPKGTSKIDEGKEIIIATEELDTEKLNDTEYVNAAKQTGKIVATGIVLKCDVGRLHTRAWI